MTGKKGGRMSASILCFLCKFCCFFIHQHSNLVHKRTGNRNLWSNKKSDKEGKKKQGRNTCNCKKMWERGQITEREEDRQRRYGTRILSPSSYPLAVLEREGIFPVVSFHLPTYIFSQAGMKEIYGSSPPSNSHQKGGNVRQNLCLFSRHSVLSLSRSLKVKMKRSQSHVGWVKVRGTGRREKSKESLITLARENGICLEGNSGKDTCFRRLFSSLVSSSLHRLSCGSLCVVFFVRADKLPQRKGREKTRLVKWTREQR